VIVEPNVAVHAEGTRDKILAAAREVIARKGKRGATTREIADVAGVNEATLFRHFGSKEALMLAVVQHFCGALELQDVVDHLSGTLEEELYAIAFAVMTRLMSVRDMIRWSLVEEEFDKNMFDQANWRPHTLIHGILVEYMTKRVETGDLRGDPVKLALVFLGSIFAQVIGTEKFPLAEIYGSREAALHYFVNVFLNGVRSDH